VIQFKFIPKASFFDREPVIAAVGRAKVKTAMRSGGRIRTFAMRSMRRVKDIRKPSKPGRAPNAHVGHLRKLIYFAFERMGYASGSLFIGPVKFAKGEAPGLNEFGGTVVRTNQKTGRVQRATYPKRPFMAPALAYELPNIPDHWKGAVKA
jgi:hypothetical protein